MQQNSNFWYSKRLRSCLSKQKKHLLFGNNSDLEQTMLTKNKSYAKQHNKLVNPPEKTPQTAA